MRRLIILIFAIFAVISFTSCHEHTYSSEWSSDTISHWHDSTCGHNVKSDIASHVWVSGDVIQEATYDSTGLVLLTCEVCGQTRQGETPRLERQIDIEGTVWKSEDIRYYSNYSHTRLSGYMYYYFYKNSRYSIWFRDQDSAYEYDSGYWEKTSGDEFKTWWEGRSYDPERYRITLKDSDNGETYHFKDPIDGGYFEYFSGIY